MPARKRTWLIFTCTVLVFLTGQVTFINEISLHDHFGVQYTLVEQRKLMFEHPLQLHFARVNDFAPNAIVNSSYYAILHNNSQFPGDEGSYDEHGYLVRVDFTPSFDEITGVSLKPFPVDNKSIWGIGLGYNGSHFFTFGHREINTTYGEVRELLCFTENMEVFVNRMFPVQFTGTYTGVYDAVIIDNWLWTLDHGFLTGKTNLTRYDLSTLETEESIELPVSKRSVNEPRELGYFKDMVADGEKLWIVVSDDHRNQRGIKFYSYSLQGQEIKATINGYTFNNYRNVEDFFNGYGAVISNRTMIDPLWDWWFNPAKGKYDFGLKGFTIWEYRIPTVNIPLIFWLGSTGLFVATLVVIISRYFQLFPVSDNNAD